MAMSYANLQDRVEQFLQDASSATFTPTITNMWIEEGLKKLSQHVPHIVEVIFKIESRTGTDVTGTTDSLTDTVEDQFLDTDDDNEKVVHNTTDHTWAVVEGYTDETVLTLSADIMDANEEYEIYNKRCWNEKQIYIGDMAPYLWIDSVEYPIGTKRNWKVYDDVLEIDVDSVDDSDSTLTDLGQVNVLVRFARPHILSQLTDWSGTLAASAAAAATSISASGLQTAGTIEIGEEFHLENQRIPYIVTADATIASNTAAVTFFPGLETAASSTEVITFRKSTLQPQHENILYRLVSTIAVQSEAIKHINAIPKGGANTWGNYIGWAGVQYNSILEDLGALSPPRTKRRYPTDR